MVIADHDNQSQIFEIKGKTIGEPKCVNFLNGSKLGPKVVF